MFILQFMSGSEKEKQRRKCIGNKQIDLSCCHHTVHLRGTVCVSAEGMILLLFTPSSKSKPTSNYSLNLNVFYLVTCNLMLPSPSQASLSNGQHNESIYKL